MTAMPDYALHDQLPCNVVTPATAEDLAVVLRQATIDGAGVVPWGQGTQQHLGGPPTHYNIALCTANLNRVIDYTPADLVINVEAGATLGNIQRLLAQHGQWLPWNPPYADAASIGGLLATAASGPLRLAHGTPRDWTLELEVALGDGRLVKSGAKVVKNVAGYDAHKLHLGAFGTLGVIVAATFKLAARPDQHHTLLAALPASGLTLDTLEQFRTAPLNPVSLAVLDHGAALAMPTLRHLVGDAVADGLLVVMRVASVPAGAQRQMQEAARRSVDAGARCIDLEDQDDAPIWREIADFSAADHAAGAVLLRAGVRPSYLPQALEIVAQAAQSNQWPMARLGYAGVGLVYARWHVPDGTDSTAVAAALAEVRGALAPLGGYVVVEDAPGWLRPSLDLWGPPPGTLGLMRRLKAQWDPANVLNPGRMTQF